MLDQLRTDTMASASCTRRLVQASCPANFPEIVALSSVSNIIAQHYCPLSGRVSVIVVWIDVEEDYPMKPIRNDGHHFQTNDCSSIIHETGKLYSDSRVNP